MLGGFVEDPQVAVGHQQPSQGQATAFPTGEGGAVLADEPARIQRQAGAVQSVADLFVGGVLVADAHVLGDGGREDVGVLGQIPDPTAPPYRARARRYQSHGGHRQGGLADAGGAGAGHPVPGSHHQVEVASEYGGAGPADGHAVEFQSGVGLPVRDDVAGADRVGVEDLPDAGQGGTGAGPRLGGCHERRQHLVEGQWHQRQNG